MKSRPPLPLKDGACTQVFGQKRKGRNKKDDVASVPLERTPIQQKQRETEIAQKFNKQEEQQEL